MKLQMKLQRWHFRVIVDFYSDGQGPPIVANVNVIRAKDPVWSVIREPARKKSKVRK